MRRLIAIWSGVALLALGGQAAVAVEVDRIDNKPDAIRIVDHTPGDVTDVEPPEAEVARWYRYESLAWDPAAAGFCVRVRWTQDQGFAEAQNRTSFHRRFDPATGLPRQNCPSTAQATPTPHAIAADTWRHIENLPVPTLSIQPGHALTGKPLYMQITSSSSLSRTVDNPLGDDVTLTATPTYSVDWGDPYQPGPTITTSAGGPWPDGDLTHTYTHAAADRTITVTATWTARWTTPGGQGGVLATLQTRSEPLHLEVRQLEATRRR